MFSTLYATLTRCNVFIFRSCFNDIYMSLLTKDNDTLNCQTCSSYNSLASIKKSLVQINYQRNFNKSGKKYFQMFATHRTELVLKSNLKQLYFGNSQIVFLIKYSSLNFSYFYNDEEYYSNLPKNKVIDQVAQLIKSYLIYRTYFLL